MYIIFLLLSSIQMLGQPVSKMYICIVSFLVSIRNMTKVMSYFTCKYIIICISFIKMYYNLVITLLIFSFVCMRIIN